ncbi:MAG: hypothetical protein AAB968_04455, partial [Patescibacteria group bacterium]
MILRNSAYLNQYAFIPHHHFRSKFEKIISKAYCAEGLNISLLMMSPESKNEKFILGGILAIALLLGIGFWGYYTVRQPQEMLVSPSPSPSAPAEGYSSKLKVTFTSDIYPYDSSQTNPRLRRYIGKIQNTGERTVDSVRIRVIYFDKSEKPVFEQFVSVATTLKPNFIEEFQFGGLEVPADWSGKADYEISEFRFADTQKVEVVPRMYYDHSRLEQPPLQQILFPF